jgi:hypothetical protein
MKHNKKNVTKMKFVRVNQATNTQPNDETQESHLETNSDQSDQNQNSKIEQKIDSLEKTSSVPTTNYKQFSSDSDMNEVVIEKPTFKLPKFLAQREETKSKLENMKKSSSDKQPSAGNLTFSPPNFSDNPNSFTSIFNKDHEKINGVQRVFRKSFSFLILQLLSFVGLSLVTISTFSLNLNSFATLSLAGAGIIAMIALYTVVSSIFYIIVADRSYIWISLLLQCLSLVLLYSFLGQGFSYPTIVFALIVSILNYFAYLEIEKVQVSTRFFSIGYVTSEAVKILSTIAILVTCLGIFNTISYQTTKVFLTRNLIDNELIFKNFVGNSSRFSLNNILQLKSDYTLNQTNKSVLSNDGKEVEVGDFIEKNYSENLSATAIKNSCANGDKECQLNLSQEKEKKLEGNLNRLVELGQVTPQPKINDRLTYDTYKGLLRGFYADKINDFETKKNAQSIPIFSSVQWLIEPSRAIFIPALIALVFYVILIVFKFIIHFITGMIIWLVWKMLVAFGLVKIEIELVESEIVSI